MLLDTVTDLQPLTISETATLRRYESVIVRGLQTFRDVGNALIAINAERLYRAQYPTFDAYCQERWGLKRQRAYELMGAAAVVEQLSESSDTLPLKESHAARLGTLPVEQRPDAWERATAIAATEGKPVVERHITQAITETHGPIDASPTLEKKGGGNDEWQTPPPIVMPAPYVLDTIDLDPASNAVAQRTVQATRFYTKADDGLAQPWAGCVWLNPPYSDPKPWMERLALFHTSGAVPAALVLVNLVSSPKWARLLWPMAPLVCLISERIAFLRPDGTPVPNNDRDSMLALVCRPNDTSRMTRFREAYGELGVIR